MKKICPLLSVETDFREECITEMCAWWVKNQFVDGGGCCVLLSLAGVARATSEVSDGGS